MPAINNINKQSSILRIDKKLTLKDKQQNQINRLDDAKDSPSILSQISQVLCSDHNTARMVSLAFSFLCSLVASVLLVVAGDPPSIEGSLYQYSDLMRLASQIHSQTITLTPEVVSDSSTKAAISQALVETTTQNRWTRLLHRWWPIKPLAFESENALLDDLNFYASNYHIFQTCFIIFILLADGLLLISWICFTISKRFIDHGAKPESESTLIRVVQCFASASGQCPLRHPVGLIVFILSTLHLTIFLLLLTRPSLFTLIIHQIVFVCLLLAILASTKLARPAPVTFRRNPSIINPKTIFKHRDSLGKVVRTPSISSLSPAPPSSTQDNYPNEVNPFEEDFESVPEPSEKLQKLSTIDEDVERLAEHNSLQT